MSKPVTLSEFFGYEGNATEMMTTMGERGLFNNKSYCVQVVLPNGEKRYLRCIGKTKEKALKEAVTFVKSIEVNEGKQVYWRFTGDNLFHLGTNLEAYKAFKNENGLKGKLKKIFEYLFVEEIDE